MTPSPPTSVENTPHLPGSGVDLGPCALERLTVGREPDKGGRLLGGEPAGAYLLEQPAADQRVGLIGVDVLDRAPDRRLAGRHAAAGAPILAGTEAGQHVGGQVSDDLGDRAETGGARPSVAAATIVRIAATLCRMPRFLRGSVNASSTDSSPPSPLMGSVFTSTPRSSARSNGCGNGADKIPRASRRSAYSHTRLALPWW